MKEEARKEIIKMLVQWADEIGENKNFWKQNRELGKTNIRTTATAILQASCYDEVKLFLEYKGSRKNTGWDKPFNNNTTFANYIINKIEDLRKKVDEKYKEDPTFDKEKEVIELAARFLGYIYWKIYGLVNQKENEERQPQNSNQSPQMKGTNYQGRSDSRQSRS
ncbi:hypothetical protein Calkr_2597 [Caldicellulosiruptor acetigenus I77R1B]|uniref:CRISPR type III-B/RAMP module-associated protein Cmr5 n=1 Tax=Caldicellulosiruptor acetigenus (strain ATCC 700853 / DSM 12137 / I77R1B) TaxID=632335 RepID=E4S915_CALA7|nr:hypothetical protein [Caldicellulosiruptor acetigenus]ADQ42020.1 hypothetical protein Calkr_2597 [Caldicellulosiruptor acetigenus I77R1B]